MADDAIHVRRERFMLRILEKLLRKERRSGEPAAGKAGDTDVAGAIDSADFTEDQDSQFLFANKSGRKCVATVCSGAKLHYS